MPNRLGIPNPSDRRHTRKDSCRLACLVRILADKIVREADVQRFHTLQILDLLVCQLDAERLDVVL